MTLLLEQVLNGLQFGAMLFMLASGLTLIFGIMGVVNLTHGSFYMVGAYCAAFALAKTGSFVAAVIAALLGAGGYGLLVEFTVIRRLYHRDHLYQVLATFGLILFTNEAVSLLFGRRPPLVDTPAILSGAVTLVPGFQYPVMRLAFIGIGALVALGLWFLVNRTRVGMLVRAGASNRQMAEFMGVRVGAVFAFVFALGAALAALAGAMMAPISAVQIGMGEAILIPALVVIVIGGIGSIRGAFVAALLVGLVDTAGRAFLPPALRAVLPPALAAELGPALAGIAMYVLMAAVLALKPAGLFPARA